MFGNAVATARRRVVCAKIAVENGGVVSWVIARCEQLEPPAVVFGVEGAARRPLLQAA